MKIVSFDAEAYSLHGDVFAIGGVVYAGGRIVDWFFARCPFTQEPSQWVKDNVLPALATGSGGSPVTHPTARAMRDDFWAWLMRPRGDETVIVVDCGWPVEAGLLSACVADDPSRAVKGPYPLHEVASLQLAAGLDWRKSYAQDVMPEATHTPHHPVYDAEVSARCAALALDTLRDLRAAKSGRL